MEILNVTLNPNDAGSGFMFTNGNLTISSSTDYMAVRATYGKITGKWYWEVKLDSGIRNNIIGISNKTFPVTSYPILNTNWRAYRGSGGNKIPENASYGTDWAVGDVIGVALDLVNGTLEFYKNGVSMGISHTNIKELKELGEVYPTVASYSSSAKTITTNFGATPFAYDVPNGFYPYNINVINKILLSSRDKYYSFSLGGYNDSLPIMTSNNTPSGTASASNEANTSYLAYKAFDKSETTRWIASSLNTGWIAYAFPYVKIIKRYTLLPRADSLVNTPKNWTFEGSNDGVNWTVLDTQNDITDWRIGIKKTFNVLNQTGYLKYRLNILATVSSGVQPSIDEFELFEKADNALVSSNEINEKYFVDYGVNTKISDFSSIIQIIKSLQSISITHESGKKFTHTVDLSKRKVDKIILS